MDICTLKVHDQTLLTINNHLVNGGGNELDGGSRGGGNQLTTLKEEILTELERRVTLSCSACQVRTHRQMCDTRKKSHLPPLFSTVLCHVLHTITKFLFALRVCDFSSMWQQTILVTRFISSSHFFQDFTYNLVHSIGAEPNESLIGKCL